MAPTELNAKSVGARALPRFEHLCAWALLSVLSTLLLVEAVVALRWRMVHDTPLLHYAAWQITELGRAPYAEVLDTSMPGSLLFHSLIGRTLGWTDAAFQAVNFGWVALTLTLTWFAVARFGERRVAWAAVVVFGLAWYGNGPWMLLQRDGVAILPIIGAVVLATSRASRRTWVQIAVGACFGVAVSIKPHLGIGFPIVALYPWWAGGGAKRSDWRAASRTLGLGLLGLLFPVTIAVGWVAARGGLPAFVDIATQYLPLHLRLSGDHQTVRGATRLRELINGSRGLGGNLVWLVPLFIGAARAVDRGLPQRTRQLLGLFVTLAVAYAVYPAFAGQFWDYHWLPFQFFSAILAGTLLLTPHVDADPSPGERRTPLVIFVAFLFFALVLPPNFRAELSGAPPLAPKEGRVDVIAEFLTENLEPGDTVQPLDWTGGAVHAMLLSRATPATRFLYDYHFYHHDHLPQIQRLRDELIDALTEAPPRFVIRFDGRRVFGDEASASFPELDFIVAERYEPVLEGDGFTILQRSPSGESASPRISSVR